MKWYSQIAMINFISMFMVLALFVATAIAPSVSHAMPNNTLKAGQIQASAGGDCHNHAKVEQSNKTAQNDKDASGECCDKGICKCLGGNCHNGLSKIFGNGSNALFRLTSNTGNFNFANDVVESALSNRLKRPPEA